MKRITLYLAFVAALSLWSCKEEVVNPGDVSGVNITLVEKDTVSAKIKFEPDAKSSYYEYAIGSESDYESFKNRTLEGIVKVDGGEPMEVVFPSLLPNTVYAVYAQSFTKDGNSAGVNIFKFATKDDRFDVQSYWTLDNAAGFKVIFPYEYYSCRYYLGTAADKDAFISGEIPGNTVSDIAGYHSVDYFDLTPESDYVFYAIGTDRLGINTELFEVPITTFASDACPNMTLETDIDIYYGEYRFIPNDKCGKIIGCILYDGTTDGYFLGWNDDPFAMFQTWETINWNGTTSAFGGETLEMNFITKELTNDNPLDVYAVICDENMVPVGVKLFEVKTPSFDESLAKPNPMQIEVTDITSKGATYTYKADETVFAYMYETVEADWYDDFKENSSEWYETYLHDRFFTQGKWWHYGNETTVYIENTGQSNFRYYAAAAPMNANGPRTGGWGDITLVPYTTNK